MQQISQKHIHFWNVWKFSKLCRKHEKPANFKEFQSFQRTVIIQANICRTWMKSRWSERLSCVVLDQFWSPFGDSSISFRFQHIFRARKIRRISRNFQHSEIDVKKTFFSEACIFSNICRNFMKSWQWERSDSEVFEVSQNVSGHFLFSSKKNTEFKCVEFRQGGLLVKEESVRFWNPWDPHLIVVFPITFESSVHCDPFTFLSHSHMYVSRQRFTTKIVFFPRFFA